MKRILLIATGGTIVSKLGKNGLKPGMNAEELLRYVPQSRRFCNVTALQLMNIDSTNMCPRDWETIASAVFEHYGQYDGFVICHGTDTLAFTAAVLSYMIQNSPKPIVLTGSQRPIDREDTDARTNLLDSLAYASDERSSGVSIVFDGKVIAGTRAKKTRTKSYNAFSSINFPELAAVRDGRVIRYNEQRCAGEPRFFPEAEQQSGRLQADPRRAVGYSRLLFSALRRRRDRELRRGRHSGRGILYVRRDHRTAGARGEDPGHVHAGTQRGERHVRVRSGAVR